MFSKLKKEITKDRFWEYNFGIIHGIIRSFRIMIKSPLILLHLAAIILTLPIVLFKIDWHYFVFFREHQYLIIFLFPAVILGGLVPILLPVYFYLKSKKTSNKGLEKFSYSLTQAGLVAWFSTTIYKMLTGRMGPEFEEYHSSANDYSTEFAFGILRRGVFDGWPSGHTAIAFAMAVIFCCFLPYQDDKLSKEMSNKLRIMRKYAFVYAFYIGMGVSTNIHWLSDAIAGSLVGLACGIAVKKNFESYTFDSFNENINKEQKMQVYYLYVILGLILIFSIINLEFLYNF